MMIDLKTTNVTPKIRADSAALFASIPPKANGKWKSCFSPHLYRDRSAIARM